MRFDTIRRFSIVKGARLRLWHGLARCGPGLASPSLGESAATTTLVSSLSPSFLIFFLSVSFVSDLFNY